MVRCGRHGEGEDIALGSGVVGIGWAEIGDLSGVDSPGQLRGLLAHHYPDAKPSALTNWFGQLEAFRSKIKLDDLVALPLKSVPAVAFGRITGGYSYVPDALPSMRHQRTVTWIREDVPRDAIDQDLRYSLGAFLTVCRIQRNNAETRILALLEGTPSASTTTTVEDDGPATATDETAPVDLAEVSRDQIRERLATQFSGHDLARLIGKILEADGFVTNVSPAGPDGGVDILAGEGEMGFDGVTLAVQVKSGRIVVDAATLRELQGVMANFGASRGLLVSWGGFTKAARAEARRLFFQIRLWDSNDVISRVTAAYGRLPPDIQADLPLRQIWTLVPGEAE